MILSIISSNKEAEKIHSSTWLTTHLIVALDGSEEDEAQEEQDIYFLTSDN